MGAECCKDIIGEEKETEKKISSLTDGKFYQSVIVRKGCGHTKMDQETIQEMKRAGVPLCPSCGMPDIGKHRKPLFK